MKYRKLTKAEKHQDLLCEAGAGGLLRGQFTCDRQAQYYSKASGDYPFGTFRCALHIPGYAKKRAKR